MNLHRVVLLVVTGSAFLLITAATPSPSPSPSGAGGITPSLIFTGLMSVLAAAFGFAGGWLATLLQLRAKRQERRETSIAAELRSTQDQLAELRKTYRRARQGGRRAPKDAEVAEREDDLRTAANRTTLDEVVGSVQRYVDVGRLYVSNDPDNGVAAEERAFDELSALVRAQLRQVT
ncbi:MAG: hypothetical protein M3P96_02965 [Actinomycetota bacterium]|nr:hypothetical protein [Actinomycetota bacterium]